MKQLIISECRELGQREYKTWHEKGEKLINWELCKKLKVDKTTKWYMHKQTDHRIQTTRSDLVIIIKKAEHIVCCTFSRNK